jgi:hypothetical protein
MRNRDVYIEVRLKSELLRALLASEYAALTIENKGRSIRVSNVASLLISLPLSVYRARETQNNLAS